VDQRTCLAATRQLLADLEGEVARLARANQSDECVCGEAHPRLRPVVATLRQQLDRLDGLTELQQQACRTAELADEEMHLARSQTEIRGQLDHWLDRRQTLDRVTRRCSTADDSVAPRAITGADSERQATARRFELWEERGRLQTRITELKPQLRELRAERDVVEYRRTEILSPRTIRELERKLADVQQELERAAEARTRHATTGRTADAAMRASEFLAQITDGDLVQLRLPGPARDAQVVNRAGVSRPLEFLLPKERNQIGLSLCLALASLAAEQGIRLPIVLDEPFERMDLRATTALAAVLVEFGRRGHQLLLFTAQPAAIERFAALGTTRHKMAELFRTAAEQPLELVAATTSDGVARPRRVRRRATAKRGDQSAQASRREAG
jgi:DNA repair exonuclease SbcCD ATPase subunit